MEDIPIIGAVWPADVFEKLCPGWLAVHGKPLFDVDALDWPKLLEKILEHRVPPLMFIRDVMDGLIKGGDGVGFPPGTRRPMKNDPVGRSLPFCPHDLLDLMFKNFIGPDPIKKIAEPRIVRGEGETIRIEGVLRVITRSNLFTVVLPNRVRPSGATYGESRRYRRRAE